MSLAARHSTAYGAVELLSHRRGAEVLAALGRADFQFRAPVAPAL